MATEARRKANAKWDGEHMVNLTVSLKKGIREKMRAVAKRADRSLAGYILDAFVEKACREGLLTSDQADSFRDEDDGEWLTNYLES